MNRDYSALLMEYPEVISKEQVYRICHISKRKATWLLENGIIPCKDSGKKTRRFQVRTIALTRWPMPSITWQSMACPQQTMAMQPGMSKRSYTNTASQNMNRR